MCSSDLKDDSLRRSHVRKMSKVVGIGQMMGHEWLGVVGVKVSIRPAIACVGVKARNRAS